ncbi:hypothetical protein Bca101_010174 [Brassica carinata]
MAATVRSDDSGASGHAVMARAEFTVTTEDGNGGVVVQQRHNGEETTWTRGPVVENCDEAHRRVETPQIDDSTDTMVELTTKKNKTDTLVMKHGLTGEA